MISEAVRGLPSYESYKNSIVSALGDFLSSIVLTLGLNAYELMSDNQKVCDKNQMALLVSCDERSEV